MCAIAHLTLPGSGDGGPDQEGCGCAEEMTIAAQKAGLELEQLAGMSYDLR